MRWSVYFLCIIASFILYGQTEGDYRRKENKGRGAIKEKTVNESFLKQTGGIVPNKTKYQGFVKLLNAQKSVSEDVIKSIGLMLEDTMWLKVNVDTISTITSFPEVGNAVKKAKGNAKVVFADLQFPESVVVLPECRAAIVNVAALRQGADEKLLASRLRKASIRAFCFALQLQYPKATGGLMDPAINSIEELDKVLIETPEPEVRLTIDVAADRFGITKFKRTTYRTACEKGFASPPKDAYQKAIWNEFRELPSKPIIIEPEKKPVAK